MEIKITKVRKSEVEIEGEIDAVVFEGYHEKIIARFGENLEVPGFRKGHVPQAMIEKNVSEMAVLEEMAEAAIADNYPKILEEHKIDAIGRPTVSLTKLARSNPLGFKITTAVVPEVKLPDYKKIAKDAMKEKKEIIVEEKEIDEALLELRRMRAHQKLHDEKVEHQSHDHTQMKEEDLPPLDEAFIKSLGNFKDLEELRVKIKENLQQEKENKERERRRIAAIEEILKDIKTDVPEILIQGELENIMARMKGDIERMGLTFEDYLKHLKKTEEDLRKDFLPDAEKRARIELTMAEIAKAENLSPLKIDIDTEVAHLKDQYKDIDPLRAEAYVTHILTNEKVFKFLETL